MHSNNDKITCRGTKVMILQVFVAQAQRGKIQEHNHSEKQDRM